METITAITPHIIADILDNQMFSSYLLHFKYKLKYLLKITFLSLYLYYQYVKIVECQCKTNEINMARIVANDNKFSKGLD